MMPASATADWYLRTFESKEEEAFFPWLSMPKGSEVYRYSSIYPKNFESPQGIVEFFKKVGSMGGKGKKSLYNDAAEERRGIKFHYLNNDQEFSKTIFDALEVTQVVGDVYNNDEEKVKRLFNLEGGKLTAYLEYLHNDLIKRSRKNADRIYPALEFCRSVIANGSDVFSCRELERDGL